MRVHVVNQQEFSSCCVSSDLLVLGTTLGTLHVATIEGLFITTTTCLTYAIEHVRVGSFSLIVAADIHGAVVVWDWQNGVVDRTWGGGRPLASILPRVSFDNTAGQLLLSFYDGHVVSRARGAYFGFNDTLVHEPEGGTATQLCIDNDVLLFGVQSAIVAFSESLGRVVARCHPKSADPGRVVFCVSGETLVAAWGDILGVCSMAGFAVRPFGSLRLVRLAAPAEGLGVLGGRVLVSARAPPATRPGSATSRSSSPRTPTPTLPSPRRAGTLGRPRRDSRLDVAGPRLLVVDAATLQLLATIPLADGTACVVPCVCCIAPLLVWRCCAVYVARPSCRGRVC